MSELAGSDDGDVSRMILTLLGQRAPAASICPSDAARALYPTRWRAQMDDVRSAAARLADNGQVIVTQGKEIVDIRTARGPVRIRRPRPGGTGGTGVERP